MRQIYELTLNDVYGGDGEIRYIDVEEPRLTRTRTTKKTRRDIGISVESGMDEVVTQKVKREVHTFRYINGKPVLRLGGAHGKLWGALREARGVLYAMGRPQYKSMRLLDTIQVQPVWAELEPLAEIQVEKLPQILNTFGRTSMIVQLYDVIPSCKAQIELVFPDELKGIVEGLVVQLKNMGIFNKRRATIQEFKVL